MIQFAPGLPKTRSGKIMRRILRKIAEDDFSNLGDTTTLADPTVVDDLINNRQNRKDGASPPDRKPEATQATRMPPPQPEPAAKRKSGGFFSKLFRG
jgi:hypothetical protein